MAKKMKKKNRSRSKANFTSPQVHSDKLSSYKYDSKGSTLLKDSSQDGQSIADRELKRMVRADVFRSNPQTIKATNSNPRRYR